MTAHLIAEDGLLQGLIYKLENKDLWILGRSKETADLVIDDSTVSRAHAKITKTNEGFVLQNLSKVNPTLINDEEVKNPTLLKEGDKILIGETTFMFSEEDIRNQNTKPSIKSSSNYDDIFKELNSPEDESFLDQSQNLSETILSRTPPKEDSDTSYETIFEDNIDDAPVPFSLPSQTPFLLKVVSGPNAGAEIGIEKNHSYVLGKDPQNCDILFQDLSVSRMHAKLSISNDGVLELEDLGSKNGTAVNGVPLEEKQIITSSDLVSLGTTVFLIIDREAPQETIYAAIPTKDSQESKEPIEQLPTETKSQSWKEQPIPFKHLLIAGSIAAIFLIAFSTFFSLFKANEIEVVEKDPSKDVEKALHGDRFKDLQYTFNPASGKLFITGHVLTAVDYAQMKYNLSLLPFIFSTEDSVVIDEGICKMTNELLSQNPDWYAVNIKSPEPGKFVAVGYLQTTTQMAFLSEFLNLNFPYLDRLEKKVTVEETLNMEIGSLLLSGGFGAVSYQVTDGKVVFGGVYNEKREKDFLEIIKKIEQTPAIQSVENFAVPTTPLMAAVDLSQKYQVNGITLKEGRGINAVIDGRLYSLGDFVDTMKITKIDENTILLEKDGVKYRINFMQ